MTEGLRIKLRFLIRYISRFIFQKVTIYMLYFPEGYDIHVHGMKTYELSIQKPNLHLIEGECNIQAEKEWDVRILQEIFSFFV